MYNDKKWVKYIKKNLPKCEHIYSGNPWTLRCFKKYDSNIKKIKLIKGISSTKIRTMMIKNKNWKKLVPTEVAEYIEKIRGIKRIQKIYAKK